MNVSFTKPLDDAWLRMKRVLLQPFDLGKWFVLGFTAWLASLSGGGGGGNANEGLRFTDKFDRHPVSDWGDSTTDTIREFFSSGLTGILVSFLIVAALILFVVVLWLSCRGKFMFLDNLVHDRTEVRRPWHEFRKEGDALFVWQLVFIVAVMVVLGIFAVVGALVFIPLGAADVSSIVLAPMAILAGIGAFILLVTVIYIQFFLENFVTTIMYRERIGVNAAWSRFNVLFRSHPGSFVVYGLFYLLIMIVAGILYFLGGLLTCCVGLLLLALPYIGAVLTLPLSVLARYWDLEFLGQFGADYRLLDPLPGPYGPTPPSQTPVPSESPEELPDEPMLELDSGDLDDDGTVVGPEDVGEDPGGPESGQQDS